MLRIVLALVMGVMAVGVSGVSRDRRGFHHRHFNVGGVCLLSSYGFLVEYANSTDDVIAPFDNYDVMSRYLEYHSGLEPVRRMPASYLRAHPEEGESVVSGAINGYCMSRGWSGYIQIENFHEWLRGNSVWVRDIERVERGSGCGGEYIQSRLESLLGRNADPAGEYDYAALVIFSTPSGPHSVFVGYDGDFFIRDVNFTDKFTDRSASFGFSWGDSDRLQEYMVFRLRRHAVGGVSTRWRKIAPVAVKTVENRFGVCGTQQAVRHLRVDTSRAVGLDGTNAYTELRLKSRSGRDVVVEYGHYFAPGYLRVNGEWRQAGSRVAGSVYEYDLAQICDDLYLWGFQPNVDFSRIRVQ